MAVAAAPGRAFDVVHYHVTRLTLAIRGWTLFPVKVPNCNVWPGMTAIVPPDLVAGVIEPGIPLRVPQIQEVIGSVGP